MPDAGKGGGSWKFTLLLFASLSLAAGMASFWASVAGSLLKICQAAL